MDTKTILRLGVSLALGLLVGLQRERTESSLAGIRTFPLISLFGTMCGLLAVTLGGWVVAAGLVAMAMFGIGAYLAEGELTVAVVSAGAIALLLQFKEPMHEFVAAVGEKDIRA